MFSVLVRASSAFLLFLRTALVSSEQYKAGMSNNVINVDTVKPQATVIPKPFHISAHSPRPIAIGIIPNTVVKVVIRIGRRRERAAFTVASFTSTPRSSKRVV